MKKIKIFCSFFIFILIIFSPILTTKCYATYELAEKTGKDCSFCHLSPDGGGELTDAGKSYLPKQSLGKKAQHLFRLIVGYIHILFAVFWFGTILYVHIILKPSYAAHGLPRREVKGVIVSMVVMAVTGMILAAYRVPSLSFLIKTRFGILLVIKIVLFLIMVSSAFYVVIVIGPKMGRRKEKKPADPQKGLNAEDLASFDGTAGEAAYIAYKGQVYDLSKSEYWKDGEHFGRHRAGSDLTGMLDQAPHGEEKLVEMPQVGNFVPSRTKKIIPSHSRVFYFIAYINLILVFLIILILALWRFW